MLRQLSLKELDHKLSNQDCDFRANLNLAIFSFCLFLFQQLLEFSILLNHNATYQDLCRFDCAWYASIMDHGYDQMPKQIETVADQRNVAFFPLFPILAKIVKSILALESSELALVITSKIFFLLSIFAFIKFAKKYFPDLSILAAGMVVALNPYVIYANSGYTESLFLFLTCTSFYLMKSKKYLACGTSGAFLSATRLVGICFAASYAISFFKDFLSSNFKQKSLIVFAGLMTGFGLICFMIFMYFHVGDFLAFIHISKVPGWNREIGNPLTKLFLGLRGGNFSFILTLITVFALSSAAFFAIKKNYELAIFSLLCTLIPLSTGLVSIQR